MKPQRWMIVDTSSTDDTLELAARLAERVPFVRTLSTGGTMRPVRGGPIVRGFITGVEALDLVPDIVVKLDADLSFEPDYFERLVPRSPRMLASDSERRLHRVARRRMAPAVRHPPSRVGSLPFLPLGLLAAGAATGRADGVGRDRLHQSPNPRLERADDPRHAIPSPSGGGDPRWLAAQALARGG